MGALWRPLGLPHFLVCATRVLQWGSKKEQNQFTINGLGRFGGTLLGRPTWTIPTQIAFPWSVALILCFREAFPCSVALVFSFSEAFPCSAAFVFRPSDVMKRYKNNGFRAWHSFRGSLGEGSWGGLSGSWLLMFASLSYTRIKSEKYSVQ